MIDKKTGKVSYKSFGKLSRYSDLINFASTRKNGNMAFTNGDRVQVKDNLQRFFNAFNISLEKCIFADQVHSNKVGIVNDINDTKLSPNDIKVFLGVDALVTRTAGEIAKETIKTMTRDFGSNTRDVIVGIGPSMGPDDYLIMDDVAQKFNQSGVDKDFLTRISDNQWKLDLWGINKQQLMDTGVKEGSIEVSGISTFSSDLFFSYRKKNPIGHFITGAMLI